MTTLITNTVPDIMYVPELISNMYLYPPSKCLKVHLIGARRSLTTYKISSSQSIAKYLQSTKKLGHIGFVINSQSGIPGKTNGWTRFLSPILAVHLAVNRYLGVSQLLVGLHPGKGH